MQEETQSSSGKAGNLLVRPAKAAGAAARMTNPVLGLLWWPIYLAIIMPFVQVPVVAFRLTRFNLRKPLAVWVVWPTKFLLMLVGGDGAALARIGFFVRSRFYSLSDFRYWLSGLGASSPQEPANYNQIQASIINRDEEQCTVCGAGAREAEMHVDHIVPRRWGGTHDPENLRTLCRNCHGARHLTTFK